MNEILASQKQMLIRRGEPTDKVSDERMAEMFGKHLRDVEAWLEKQSNMDVLYVSYNEMLDNPASSIEMINRFLGGALDGEKMTSAVDRNLHRQRR
jgi:broad-specificity NMP kinase